MNKLVFALEGPEHESALRRFSDRLKGTRYQDWPLRFYWNALPGAPPGDEFIVRRRRLLALEDGEVRGHQNLFHHEIWIAGVPMSFAWVNGPLSESVRDLAFAQVSPSLLKKGLTLEPRQMMLGHLSIKAPPASLLLAMRWQQVPVPSFILPLRLSRVLRGVPRERFRRRTKYVIQILSWIPGLSTVWRFVVLARSRARGRVTLSVEREFGTWADELWDRARSRYDAVARRDAAVLNRVYSSHNTKFWRLRVRRGDHDIGWALLTMVKLEPSMGMGVYVMGTIIDAFADPLDTQAVVAASVRFLNKAGADAVYASWSHQAWRDACVGLGAYQWSSQYRLLVSRALASLLPKFPDISHMHISRGDCDGPLDMISRVPLPQVVPGAAAE